MNDDDLDLIDEPVVAPEPQKGGFGDLGVRVASGLALAAMAMTFFYLGGSWTSGMLAVAAALMMWEFRGLVQPKNPITDIGLWVMMAGGIGGALVGQLFGLFWAMAPLGLAVAALVAARRKAWIWNALGVVYLGVPMAALAHLRGDTNAGLILVAWLVLIVVATDIGGYFVGRLLGGPKLWPAISPGKTWSGTLGGWALAAAVGLGFGLFAPDWPLWSTVLLSVLLGGAAQIGDLGESWVKRRRQVKDSSRLIPGHGGLLDRLDGLVAAVNVFVLSLVF